MRLKRLEIYGFKSFADRTVVVFDEGITGIVGPNGSGKSNLSDAVRWVLGEQSAKALRGGKMEDVIFNGTQKRKRMGYCEVSLVFENEDHALSVDYTEVMITRRVYRSGEGEYYINKSACRLKDIVELFRDTGVGKEGYSIIGQGRIDEILSQKSEDRRGVFEEAAGIVKYRTRKEESEKRLSNMRDNLSRVEDIIAELESQLEPLEKASETARRYLNLRDELRVLECSAFVLRSDRAKERIAEAEQLLTGLKEAIASEEKRADALSEQREKANEGAQKLENEVTAAHDAVLELTRETEAREGELGVLRAEINRMEKDVLALGQEEDVKRARSAALDEEIAKNERDALANRTRIIGLTRELSQKEEALQNAQEEARQAEEKLEAHKSAIIDAMNRLSDVRTSEARLSTMRRELERRREKSDMMFAGMARVVERFAVCDLDRDRYQYYERHGEALYPPEGSYQQLLEQISRKYVVLTDSDLVINLPLDDVLRDHIDSGADLTAVCTSLPGLESDTYFQLDNSGRIVDVAHDVFTPEGFRCLNIFVLRRDLLIQLVTDCMAHNQYSFRHNILQDRKDALHFRAYVWDGYAAQLRSVQEYYDRSMELLQGSIRAELFAAARPILAKEDDEASSYFAPGSRVKNSLVADGCTIEGSVENCILFPGVTVEKGAELRDSILFKGTRVRDGVTLRYVITDKYVEVLPGRTLMGHESYPIVISKGSIV